MKPPCPFGSQELDLCGDLRIQRTVALTWGRKRRGKAERLRAANERMNMDANSDRGQAITNTKYDETAMGLDGRGALCQAEVFDSISVSSGEAQNIF